MSISDSLILLSVFLIAYMAIIEIFTVLFRLLGLPREKARMQVISMLTNSGFTTAESEIIMSSKRRRKLARITMLFGYSFGVIIVSVLVNIFLAFNQTELNNMLFTAIVMAAVFTFLVVITRVKAIKSGFDHVIEKLGNRIMFGKGSNAVILVDTYGENAVTEIHLKLIPAVLDGVCLADAELRQRYGIQVLFIKRGGLSIYKIDGEMVLKHDDTIFLFGDYKNIRALFEHPSVLKDTAE